MEATEKQVKDRWRTPKGKKVRQQIIEHIKEDNWKKFLVGFPHVEEVWNGRDLRGINLKKANLWKANLEEVFLWKANLEEANLIKANLAHANLFEVNLKRANLRWARLFRTFLVDATLENATLFQADLVGANLIRTNLKRATLFNATLGSCQFIKTDLSGADLSESYIYGISTWDIKTDKDTIMKNLIINNDPLITVNDIEIAQFIYMISNNKRIRNIIDTMRTKAVLILGSFDESSKLILNKFTETLQNNNLIPIVFYFRGSIKQSLIETVKTMALLSRFVIIDLSIRSGQLYELGKIGDSIKVPYAITAYWGTKVTDVLDDLHKCFWVRKNIFIYPKKDWENKIPILVKDKIIPWADKINKRLLMKRN